MSRALAVLIVVSGAIALAEPPSPTLYVANQSADTVSVVDGRTFAVRQQISTGKNPHEILVDARARVAYVSNRQEDTVSVIDLTSLEERARLKAPGMPHGLALSPDAKTLFVTGRSEITVVDLATRAITSTIPVGQGPHMLHASPDRTRLYTGNMRDGTLTVIDTVARRVVATVPVGKTPEDFAVSPDGREVVVGNQDEDSLTAIDAATNTVTATIRLPERGAPIRVRYAPDGRTVFVASRRDGAGVLRLERGTWKVTGHIPVEGLCVGMNFSPDARVLYITDLRKGTIAEVDPSSLTILRTLSTGAGADCIEVVP